MASPVDENSLGSTTLGAINGGGGRGLISSILSASSGVTKIVSDLKTARDLLKEMAGLSEQIGSNLGKAAAGGKRKGGNGKNKNGLAEVPETGKSQTASIAQQAMGGRATQNSMGMPMPSFGGLPSVGGLPSISSMSGFGGGGAGHAHNPTSGFSDLAGKLPAGGAMAAQIGLATVAAATQMLPSTMSGVDRQQALFQTGLATGAIGPVAYNSTGKLGLATFGNYMTSVNSDVRSMGIISNAGYNPASKSGQSMLGQIGAISLTTGMSNEQVAAGIAQSANPVMANRLLSLGINQNTGGAGGGPQSVAQLADQLVRSVYIKPTPEKIRVGLRPGGALDMMIRDYVPDPTMQEMVRDAMFKMALNNGKAIKNDAETMTQLGLADSTNNPRTAGMRYTSTETALSERFRDANTTGYTGALDAATNLTQAFISLTEAVGPLADNFVKMSSFLETFGNSRPGGAVGTFVSSLPGIGPMVAPIMGLLGHSSGGPINGPGTSTSDSIPALLSRGEFVIKASSVDKYGKELFEALNAQKFNNGGDVSGKDVADYARQFVGKVRYSGPADSGVENLRPKGVPAADPDDPRTWANGWGCSEFTNAVYKHFGISIGDWSVSQFSNGTPVSRSGLLEGDLVFFNYHGRNGAGKPDHVGIYVGDGKMVEAEGSATGTVLDDVSWNSFIGGRRYLTGSTERSTSDPSSTKPDNAGQSKTGRMSQIPRDQADPSIYTGVDISLNPLGVDVASQGILNFLGTKSSSKGTSSNNGRSSSKTKVKYTGGKSGTEFAKWLYKKGLRGKDLENMWVLGMRESRGKSNVIGNGGYGLFQIQNVHAKWVRDKYGYSMDDLLDPDRNFEVARGLSKNWSDLGPWMIDADTGELDYSDYGGSYATAIKKYDFIQQSVADYKMFRSQVTDAFHDARLPGYSSGAWAISKDQNARIHQGEMILPASVAENVRSSIREGFAGQSGSGKNVNIYVTVANGSDSEALRLARKVKDLIEHDDMLTSISGIGA